MSKRGGRLYSAVNGSNRLGQWQLVWEEVVSRTGGRGVIGIWLSPLGSVRLAVECSGSVRRSEFAHGMAPRLREQPWLPSRSWGSGYWARCSDLAMPGCTADQAGRRACDSEQTEGHRAGTGPLGWAVASVCYIDSLAAPTRITNSPRHRNCTARCRGAASTRADANENGKELGIRRVRAGQAAPVISVSRVARPSLGWAWARPRRSLPPPPRPSVALGAPPRCPRPVLQISVNWAGLARGRQRHPHPCPLCRPSNIIIIITIIITQQQHHPSSLLVICQDLEAARKG
ncbi:hypothetical protein BDZ91DRAFT_779966 [Kalaharituber pfeilii]|nr:hypothetical protein BDZ91DRAFT_779966 [Kalaharituber pfeilii]